MIRAFIFDFNGVVVDDEPLHFELFQKVLQEESVILSRDDYYERYLGMDDRDCFTAVLQDQGLVWSADRILDLIQRKARYYETAMETQPPFVPGAIAWIKRLSSSYHLAIVSGALRSEIEMLLKIGGIERDFSLIVAAGETPRGKPHPDGYQLALELLNRDFVAPSERLLPEECLVFEDSPWGIESAHGAGMPCVGLTTSYRPQDLPGVIEHLRDFSGLEPEPWLEDLEKKLAKK